LLGDVFEDGNGRQKAAIGFGLGGVWLCEGRRNGNALRPASLRKSKLWNYVNES
jgi:hypothetical protein